MSAVALERPAEPAAAEPVAPAAAPRRWSAGTLSYTTGGLVALVLLLLWGDFAWSMKERSVGPVLQIQMKGIGASDFLIGLLMGTVPGFIHLVLGPVVSYHSDRFRSRWGRRIPFLLVPTPFIVAALVLLAFAPAIGTWANTLLGGGEATRGTAVVAVIAAAWILFDITSTIANTIFGALVNDVVPRAFIGRFFGLFRALSLVAAIVFNTWFIGRAEQDATPILLGVGLLYGVGFGTMCLRVKEGAYPPPPPAAAGAGFTHGLRSYARQCFGEARFVWVYAALALATLAFLAVNAFAIFAANSFGLSNQGYGEALAISYGCSLVLAFPIGWLSDRFHPLRTGLVALVLYFAVVAWGSCQVDGPATFTIAFIAHTVLSGAFFTATAGLGQLLFPHHGFAQMQSAAIMCASLCCMALQPLLGLMLDLNGHHYRTTFGLALVLAGAAIIGWLLLCRRFPIHPAAEAAHVR